MDEKNTAALTPWARRREIPKQSPVSFVILAVAASLAGALIPLSDIITMLVLVMLGGAFLGANIAANRTALAFVSLPVSFGIAFALTGSPWDAALALLYLIPATVIAVSLLTNTSCSVSIAALAGTELALTATVFAASLYVSFGSVSKGLTEIYAFMKTVTVEFMKTYAEMLKASGLELSFSDGEIDELLKSVVAVLPGTAVFICILVSAATAKIAWACLGKKRLQPHFRSDGWRITVSSAACYVYLISYVASFLFGFFKSTEVLVYTASNLSTIFMPAVFLAGARNIKAKLTKTSATAKVIAVVICVVSALFMPTLLSILIMVISFTGAFSVIRQNREANRPKDDNP